MHNFFKSTPEFDGQFSTKKIDKMYRYWRWNIMLNIYIGYAAFYLTRKSFNYAMPDMITDLGFDKSDIGVLTTSFYITYGVSKFISGFFSDQSNPRFFMGLGLIATGIINILFGLASSLIILVSLWIVNAIFQGWGWPACSKLLTTWYSRSERGVWWSIWNTSHSLGTVILPLIGLVAASHYNWRYGFIVPGFIAIFIGVLIIVKLRDKPTTLGLPPVGVWRDDEAQKRQEQHAPQLSTPIILRRYVLGNKYLWLLGGSYILVYIVLVAINDWSNLYLSEYKGYGVGSANVALTLFELGSFIGCLIAGWGSDFLFKGNRGPMNLVFSIGIFISIAALWLININSFIFQGAILFCIGFFVCGPQMLIGMAAAECSHQNAAGAATGFVGLFAYIGASLAGYPMAKILEQFGWNGFFIVVSLCSAGIGLLLLPFLQVQFPLSTTRKESC